MLNGFARLRRFGTLILLTALLVACATSPTGRRQLMLVSEQEAINASKQAYVQMLAPLAKEGRIDSDPTLTRRVRRITDRLIVQAERMRPETRNWEWSVKVIDDPQTVNAWCMAGGRMAIYTGLIQQLKPTDDELAQVMGHEIAHALANHTAEKMSVALATMVGITAVGVAAGEEHRGAALAGAALAAKLAVELPNSRTTEAEADRIGIELAARAGYDPRAAVTLWEKMSRLGGGRVPEFLSTHPAPENRIETLRALVPKMIPLYEAARQTDGQRR
ncbi:MAG TPA: M48 family peptidase [Gammaproteobacteria bacterium]|nr:M48 family peptidase [Gammaproteobacteria bacterium]